MSSNEQEGLSIALVGAGIAGLALAIGLHRQNIHFTLYEDASQYSTTGAGIGLGPNGLGAMDLIEEGFRRRYEAICVGNKSREDQNVFFEGLLCQEGLGLDQSWYGRSSWGSPNYTRKSAHRRELLDILTSFIPREKVRFGKKLIQIEQHDSRVVLRFADGEVARASALIGADGITSIVREHVLEHDSPDQIKPIYAHSYVYRAVISMAEAEGILGDLIDTAKIFIGRSYNVTTYRVSGGEELNFLFMVYDHDRPWPLPNSVTQEVSREEMLADFEGRGMDQRLLRLLEKARPIRWGLFHHLATSTYYRDRVVLIGDSAHASLPYQAAGAGQGAEDAAVLSHTLGHMTTSPPNISLKDKLHAAFEAYDAVRRPRAQRQTAQSLETTLLLTFQDSEAGSDICKVLERMRGDRFDWLWFHNLQGDVQIAKDMMDKSLSAEDDEV